jgi:hypothetical protein
MAMSTAVGPGCEIGMPVQVRESVAMRTCTQARGSPTSIGISYRAEVTPWSSDLVVVIRSAVSRELDAVRHVHANLYRPLLMITAGCALDLTGSTKYVQECFTGASGGLMAGTHSNYPPLMLCTVHQ